MAYNIKQITDVDVKSKNIINQTILMPSTRKKDDGYEIVENPVSVPYRYAIENTKIVKMGYCCEPRGIDYPIFLQMNGSYHLIKIGKTGMYEMQPEKWRDINILDSEEEETNVSITGILVPDGIKFTLDYILIAN